MLSFNHAAFAAVKLIEYRNLMIGRFLFIMGLRMMGTLVGWWVYQLTKDPFAIGLIGLAEVIPAVSLSLYAGHVIDMSEKRKIMLTGALLYFFSVIALLVLSYAYDSHIITSTKTTWIVYAVIFCTGIFRAFTGPTFGTMVALIVPRDILQNAITWNQSTWLIASVTGHALAGLLIAVFNITGTLLIIAFFVLMGLGYMSKLQKRPPVITNAEKKTFESVKEGLRFVFKTKEILGALSLDLFAVLFGGAVAMIPVFATDILKVGPTAFGWLNAASDIGSVISVLMLTFYPMRKNQGKKLLFAVGGFGLCIIVFALSKNFWLSFFVLLLSGWLDGVSVVVRGTILQMFTPDDMRGRVMSVNSMFINSSNELGQFESGLAAKLMGVVPSVIFGGCMTLCVVITTWFKAPTLKKLEY